MRKKESPVAACVQEREREKLRGNSAVSARERCGDASAMPRASVLHLMQGALLDKKY